MLTANPAAANRGGASQASRIGLLLTIAAFVAMAGAWNMLVPPFEGLDELEHFEVVRHVASTGRLPVHDVADAAGYRVRQEASQPPLYYYLAAGWTRLLALPLVQPVAHEVPAQLVACGSEYVPYNKAVWRHSPAADAPPWSGALRTLHGLRFFSTLLGVATLCGAYTLARRLHLGGLFVTTAVGAVAFNPQFLLLAAGVNNDNVVIPLATWGLVVAYDQWRLPPARWRPFLLGLVCGASALSKLSGLGLLGVAALALLLRWVQRRSTLRRTVTEGAAICGTAVALISPWLLRNLRLYGDLTALGPMLAKVGLRATGLDWGEVRLLVLSYWGQLPCSFYPRGIYWPYLILTVGGVVGIALSWRRFRQPRKVLLAICAGWLAVISAAWVHWTSTTPAPGGRLLFPAIAAVSILCSVGWHAARPRWDAVWGALLPVWALVALVAGPVTIYLPPPTYSPTPTPRATQPVAFGDAVALVGHTVALRTDHVACLLSSRAHCGPVLDVALDWQALGPIDGDLTLVIQLVSAAPGSTDLRLNYNYWPGRGNLRTSVWPEDRIIRDRYRLPLPPYDGPTQAWDVSVAFTEPHTGVRLPVRTAVTSLGEAAVLARIRVPDNEPAAPAWANPSTPVSFDGRLALVDAAVIRTGSPWQVKLLWEGRARTDQDFVTFVHAYSPSGELIATGDGPPMDGAFPTSDWVPGDRVLSTHSLVIPLEAIVAYVGVGMYDGNTGERATTSFGGRPLADDTVVIWAREP